MAPSQKEVQTTPKIPFNRSKTQTSSFLNRTLPPRSPNSVQLSPISDNPVSPDGSSSRSPSVSPTPKEFKRTTSMKARLLADKLAADKLLTEQSFEEDVVEAKPEQKGKRGRLNSEQPPVEQRKNKDAYNFYNIAALGDATLFADIIEPKSEEFGCKIYPYIGKFDRSLRAHQSSLAKLSNPYPTRLVDIKKRVVQSATMTRKKCLCPEYEDISTEALIQGTMYPRETPPFEYIEKKSLKINPIYIKQRIRTRHKNILVINFEGVIGDYFKKNLIDISCPGLYMRPGSIQALKCLQEKFQLILICGYRTLRILKILSFLNREGVQLTGAYQLRKANQTDEEDMVDKKLVNFLDYSRIYRDLKLKPPFNTKVLILCPINLSRQDISERMDIDLIRDGIMKRSPVFVEKIPVDSDSNFELPIVLAVPNPRSAVGGEVLNMMAVADVITDLAENTAISASWIDNFQKWQLGPSNVKGMTGRTNYMAYTKLVENDSLQDVFLSLIREIPGAYDLKIENGLCIAQTKLQIVEKTRSKRRIKDVKAEVVGKSIWDMHQRMIVSTPKPALKNRFIVIWSNCWLYSEMVGRYELIEYEQVTMARGSINLMNYAEY